MRPETGWLVIADLTGYTAYLARGEIEHAPRIAGDLLETVVGRLEPPFRLAKIEGDAVFLHVEDGRADGSLLLDALEAAYLAFRRRLRSIQAGTSCGCAACSTAPRLDLKLFLHHGSYVRHRVARRIELSGPDVILVHRLLKGTASEVTDGRGMAQVTEDAVHALGIDPGAQAMTPHGESLDGVGSITTFVLDLDARWSLEQDQPRMVAPADGVAIVDLGVELDAPPQSVWEHLTRPELRTTWEGPVRIEEVAPGGRRGRGSITTCVTGRLASLEEVVDWQPFEHLARLVRVPGIGTIVVGADMVAAGPKTRLRTWTALPDGVDVAPETRERLRVERAAAVRRLADRLQPVGVLAGSPP